MGVVGELQFEVFSYRLKAEYGADIRLQRLPYQLARWVAAKNRIEVSKLSNLSSLCVTDQDDRIVVLCESEYALRWLEEKNADFTFYANAYKVDDHYELSNAT